MSQVIFILLQYYCDWEIFYKYIHLKNGIFYFTYFWIFIYLYNAQSFKSNNPYCCIVSYSSVKGHYLRWNLFKKIDDVAVELIVSWEISCCYYLHLLIDIVCQWYFINMLIMLISIRENCVSSKYLRQSLNIFINNGICAFWSVRRYCTVHRTYQYVIDYLFIINIDTLDISNI